MITFPTEAYRRLSTWPELDSSGIYVLVSPAIGEFALRAHVGEARNLQAHFDSHESDHIDWRAIQIIAIASAGNRLSECIAGHVVQQLASALHESGLVEIDKRLPACPPIAANDRMRAERFFRDALLLMAPVEPMMGMVAATMAGRDRRRQLVRHDAPEPVVSLKGVSLYELKQACCHAYAIKLPSRRMRVLAGARVATKAHDEHPRRALALRQRLIADGSLVHSPQTSTLILTRDVEVYSPAGAASLITGRRMNGSTSWIPATIVKEARNV
ncbi:MAG: DUF4357 domain-containing protein [Novosphingobium sp.]|uniref:DUF4357 domain-containing protein n=1 Tax=Novosphingobium sp. TaxID=1874826 RepID=UPI0022CC7EF3|nr:DUF4357 domain-containing protein [Novosphingobium sp.]MCZ8036488.1 DUF4357 domain-containing protein [Novosphingobium sp.]